MSFFIQAQRIATIIGKPVMRVMKDAALQEFAGQLMKSNLEAEWLKSRPDLFSFVRNNPHLLQKWET